MEMQRRTLELLSADCAIEQSYATMAESRTKRMPKATSPHMQLKGQRRRTVARAGAADYRCAEITELSDERVRSVIYRQT
jgi:hypothetical protein